MALRNDQEAPIKDLPALVSEQGGSTQTPTLASATANGGLFPYRGH